MISVRPNDPRFRGLPSAVVAKCCADYARAAVAFEAEARDRLEGLGLSVAEAAAAQAASKEVAKWTSAVSSVAIAAATAAQAAPVVGQVIGAVAAVVAAVAQLVALFRSANYSCSASEKRAGVTICTGWTPYTWSPAVETGWFADGRQAPAWYFESLPLLGPLAEDFAREVRPDQIARWRAGKWYVLVSLMTAFPLGFGAQVQRCTIEGPGPDPLVELHLMIGGAVQVQRLQLSAVPRSYSAAWVQL